MLVMVMMLIVPVMDAFACSAEMLVAHVEQTAVHDQADDEGASDHTHGVCGHDQCHHNTAYVSDQPALTDYTGDSRALWIRYSAARVSNVSDGLMRPPRI